MAYANRFQQQLRGPSPAARAQSARVGGMSFGMDGLHTRRKEENSKSAARAQHLASPEPAQLASPSEHHVAPVSTLQAPSTPNSKTKNLLTTASRRPLLSSKGQTINAGDLSIFSSKLRALMVVREQIEQLAQRHKQEESRLAQFMKQLLRGNIGTGVMADSMASREQLVAAIADRDKAIATLDQFRTEINEVMSRMHKSLLSSHSQHEQDIRRIEMLTNENNRLRSIVFDVYGGRDDDELENSNALENAERTIEKLNELLQEADAVLVNLRANNEELLRQNHELRLRDRQHHEQTFAADDAAASPNSPAAVGSESLEEGASSADIGSTTVHSTAVIESLRAELRQEKRHRLEAEEVSHQIMVEHTKNVRLLEQRLQHRNTPKETPRRSSFRFGSPSSTDRTREVDLLFEAKEISADEIGAPESSIAPPRIRSLHSRELSREAGSDWSYSGINVQHPIDESGREGESPAGLHATSDAERFRPDTNARELQAIEQELLRVAEALEGH